MERGGGVHVGGEGAKGKPAATERMKESASMDAGRARVDREGEDKPMSMERGERQAHDDGKGEGARVNGRRTSPRRWKGAKEPASTDGGQAHVDGEGEE